MYYLYHIPGKKIGVTRDLNTRVTLIQGYKPSEYEVLDQSDDIDYISDKEIELQKSYGYKVDLKKYKNLFKKMKINVTEQTSTFAVPLNKLKGHLMDNMDLKWETSHGEFNLDLQTINWIIDNAKVSMYNDNRSYIYNKAFAEYFKTNIIMEIPDYNKSQVMFDKIRTVFTEAVESGIGTSTAPDMSRRSWLLITDIVAYFPVAKVRRAILAIASSIIRPLASSATPPPAATKRSRMSCAAANSSALGVKTSLTISTCAG